VWWDWGKTRKSIGLYAVDGITFTRVEKNIIKTKNTENNKRTEATFGKVDRHANKTAIKSNRAAVKSV
jgi:hypothetical protein